jgi:2-polyprenyl-3-methyl-5-hydroxy-6-metoxy-1,4-benzoquinol methylase
MKKKIIICFHHHPPIHTRKDTEDTIDLNSPSPSPHSARIIRCPVCKAEIVQIGRGYAACKACQYMMSDGCQGAGAEVASLDSVREKNFRTICTSIKQEFPSSNTILDVGCSRGAFLKIAREEGFTATGLEPDIQLAANCRAMGYEVLDGFFPDAETLSGKVYDVIIFNDSFEHIPHLQHVISGIKKHLHPSRGGVVINLPTSDGLIFRIAFFLSKFGIYSPFDRLWQRGFASPHLHYFNASNLRLLLEQNNFILKRSTPLCYYMIKGLWGRISCKSSFCVSLISWFALILFYPFVRMQSDCFAAYFSRVNPEEIGLFQEPG